VPSIYSDRLVNVDFQPACSMMTSMLTLILVGLLRGVRTQRSLVFKNLALRHQLAVLQRTAPRPRLRTSDRLLWVLLSRLWSGWTDAVSVVQPATVIRWQRAGFTLVWTRKSRRTGPGRPAVPLEVRALVVLNETHLRCLLRDYLIYYHRARTHLSLDKDAPEPRLVEHPDQGGIVQIPMVGGLHHRYTRQAA
jgi:hypothetical protein